MASILIVDDEAQIRWIFSKILQEEGHRVETAEDGPQALNKIRDREPDLVFLDYRLKSTDGLEVLRSIKKEGYTCPVIMITAYESIPSAVSAIKEGAFDYLNKPLNNEEIVYHAQKALEVARLSRQVHEYRSKISEIIGPEIMIGHSQAIKEILKMLEKIASGDISVLITGESGTGKEMVARLLHQKSDRREGPFITVDCGAVPETLIESELFGHEKGAFTGAANRRQGKFELADGGSIFLDEISNASAGMQAKILRALEQKSFHRLGGKNSIIVDVRVISATNRVLSTMVEQGKFRQDLYFRLKGIDLRLPLLRERREDIPELVDFFAERYAKQQHKSKPGLSEEAVKALINYSWPGNVRELRNVIERAVLLGDETIGIDHLPYELTNMPEGFRQTGKIPGATLRAIRQKALAEVERQTLQEVLKRCRGNKRATARELDIDPKTLYKLLSKYDLK